MTKFHQPDSFAHQQEDGSKVQRLQIIELLERGFNERLVGDQPGVVDEDVDAA